MIKVFITLLQFLFYWGFIGVYINTVYDYYSSISMIIVIRLIKRSIKYIVMTNISKPAHRIHRNRPDRARRVTASRQIPRV